MKQWVNGFNMNFEEVGKGLPILFIHGYPLSKEVWGPQLAGLSDIARCIAPDLRGHGESESVPGPYSMDLFADDLAALLDELNIQGKAVICGLSMGGYAAFGFYRRHPGRVAGMILAGTRAGGDSPERQSARDASAEIARKEGILPVVKGMLPKMFSKKILDSDPDLVELVRSIMLSVSLEGMIADLGALRDRPDSRPMLAGISVPVLVIHGLEDQMIPFQDAEEMSAKIPGAVLQLIPGAGHLLNLETPDTFNQAIRQFIKQF